MRLFLGFFTHCGFKAQGESFTICSKCKKVESSRSCFSFVFPLQIYYCEYYEKYLEEYERRRLMMMNENSASAAAAAMAASSAASGSPYDASNNAALVAGNVEASILMDDIMNNGMTFCSIM